MIHLKNSEASMKLIFWLVCLVLLTHVVSQVRNVPQYELDALYDLFNSTNGVFWEWYPINEGVKWNFGSGADPCQHWQGIKCVNSTTDDNLAFVGSIELASYNLTGTVPPSIGNFSELQALDLGINSIFRTIPPEIGKLSLLYELALNDNLLTGKIPVEVYSCSRLMYFRLQNNYIGGSISPEIGNLTQLSSIRFERNQLTGTIPPQLSNCSVLGGLVLSHNQLRGHIPPELGQIHLYMFSFMIDNNFLTGPFPPELGGMCNSQLYSIYANNNELTGTIPSVFDDCSGLQYLYLDNNSFHGPLPLIDLTVLNFLNLGNNKLTGTIPVTGVYAASMNLINLSSNRLNGTIPSTMFQNNALFSVFLNNNSLVGPLIMTGKGAPNTFDASHNQLTGPLPEALFDSYASTLDLSYNQFHGTIPESIVNARQLVSLNMKSNKLYGTIPNSMVNLTLLYSLSLALNDLSGTIPKFVTETSLSYFQIFDVESNSLEGTIPPSLLGSDFMLLFSAGDNYLTGTIPTATEVTAMSGISVFDNLLTGAVPDISHLPSLQLIFIDDNMLTGDLGSMFDGDVQTVMKYVDVSNNQLQGTIPTSPFEVASLRSFVAVSNCLYGSLPSAAICALTNLTTLAMDGMESSPSCQYLYLDLPYVYHAYGLNHKVTGGIDPCLFNIPTLQTLHLSGNEITGSLSDVTVISSSLTDLSLSHNVLTGTIPHSIQFHRWTNLDLSYNKLTGGLSHDFPVLADNASLSLEVNRLSGVIPHSLKHAKDIDILDGNLWKCDIDRTQLPINDKKAGIYECGSNTFNYSIYIWLSLCFVAFMPVALLWSGVKPKGRWVKLRESVASWMLVFQRQENREYEDSNFLALAEFADGIRWTCFLLTLFIVVILMPVYVALTHYENTYAYEYAWTVSAAYLSGLASTIVLLLCFLAVSAAAMLLLLRLLKYQSQELVVNYIRSCPTYLALSFVAVVIWNIIVVTAVNIGYVYVYASYNATIVHALQFALAVFKLVWNNWAVRELLKMTKRFEATDQRLGKNRFGRQRIGIEVFMILFNNIGAPYLATGLVSTNCFYNVIAAPPRVDVSYSYQACLTSTYYQNGSLCLEYDNTAAVSTSYEPPFMYSFQCGSTFITTYATIYVLMFIITAFLAPLTVLAVLVIQEKLTEGSALHSFVESSMPKILKLKTFSSNQPVIEGQQTSEPLLDASYNAVFHCDLFVVKVINIFAMIVTFGAVLPPLAVVGLVAVVSFTYYSQLLIGRYVVRAQSSDDRSRVIESMNRDCEHASDMFMNAVWIVAPFTTVFYAILLLDTLGDAEGWKKALWAPILVAALPVTVWIFFRIRACATQEDSDTSKKDSFYADDEAHNSLTENPEILPIGIVGKL